MGLELALGRSWLCALVSSHIPLLCRAAEKYYMCSVDLDANVARKEFVLLHSLITHVLFAIVKTILCAGRAAPLSMSGVSCMRIGFCVKLIEQHVFFCIGCIEGVRQRDSDALFWLVSLAWWNVVELFRQVSRM